MENFRTGSGKIYHRKAYKKLFRESYSRFLILGRGTVVEVTEVLSVAMTSSPEMAQTNFLFTNSEVFGSPEFNSELRFFDSLRAFASLGECPHPNSKAHDLGVTPM